jgi:gamma-glutamyltranspeptidase
VVVSVAAPHWRAVEAGAKAVDKGGNALDAALAAAAMLTVVYPHQCAIGGDLIALVRDPDGRTTAVLGAGTAPRAIDTVSAQWVTIPRFGPHAVTVPGMVAGWTAIAALGARLSLDRALRGAASIARSEEPVSAGLARALAGQAAAVAADAGMRTVFAPDGLPLAEGDPLVQEALAETLLRLADDPADMYTGTTARLLVRALRDAGGVHTLEDFSGYSAEVVAALRTDVGTSTWTVAPPPSAGAILLGVVSAADAGTPEGLVDASVRGAASRTAHLGDPRTGRIDLAALLALRSDAVDVTREPRPTGDTAAVVAMDDEGWAVTIVQSVFFTFGTGILDPESGVLLHNRGSAFSLDPASPAFLRPGARPPHTLTPAIVDDGETTVVAGCQGGRAQPWILAQLLGDALSADSLDALLARPRWVIGAQDLGHDALTLVTEPGIPAAVVDHAAAIGLPHVTWPERADNAGHVQLVRRRAGGAMDAASDPRADGLGMIVRT